MGANNEKKVPKGRERDRAEEGCGGFQARRENVGAVRREVDDDSKSEEAVVGAKHIKRD